MALEAQQMAVLQLLLVQGQSYADIGGLLGLEEAEVRTRARAALTELGDGDPDREASLTDYLLGQGDPIDRADAVRHLRSNPADRELAAKVVAELRAIAPDAELPRLPGEPRERRLSIGRAPGSERISALRERLPKRSRESGPGTSPTPAIGSEPTPQSQRQRRLFAGIAAAALALIVIVLALTGVLGGSGDSGSGASASEDSATAGDGSDSTTASSTDLSDGEDIQAIPLKASGGGDARGVATIGLAGEQTPYLDLQIENLQPPSSDQVYFVWFVQQDGQGYPFIPLNIDGQNASQFSDRQEIPTEYIPVLENASKSPDGAIQVWLSPSKELGKNIRSAVKAKGFVEIPGEQILSGSLAPADPAGGQGGQGDNGG